MPESDLRELSASRVRVRSLAAAATAAAWASCWPWSKMGSGRLTPTKRLLGWLPEVTNQSFT